MDNDSSVAELLEDKERLSVALSERLTEFAEKWKIKDIDVELLPVRRINGLLVKYVVSVVVKL